MNELAPHIDPHKTRVSTPMATAALAIMGACSLAATAAINWWTIKTGLATTQADVGAIKVQMGKLDPDAIAKEAAKRLPAIWYQACTRPNAAGVQRCERVEAP